MLPIFGCVLYICLFWSICCWQQFLALGGPPTTSQKTTEMLNVLPPKPQMENFSILGDENRVVEGWGGAAQLWAGKKLCSSNPSKFTQKKNFRPGASPSSRKLHRLEIGHFGNSQTQNYACPSNEAKNHLSDTSEISVIMGTL